jgi:hypothetical protein
MLKTALRIGLAAAIALIVQACGSMQWTKAGADPASVSRDLDECRGQALGRSGPPVASGGSMDARSDGHRIGMKPAASSNERFIEEHEVASACMRKRGYELRPAS